MPVFLSFVRSRRKSQPVPQSPSLDPPEIIEPSELAEPTGNSSTVGSSSARDMSRSPNWEAFDNEANFSDAREDFGGESTDGATTPTDSQSSDHKSKYGVTIQETKTPVMANISRKRSLSDLQVESIPQTPIHQTPRSTLTLPAAPWLKNESGDSTPSPLRSTDSLQPLHPNRSSYYHRSWVKEGSIAQLHTRDDYGMMSKRKRYAYYSAPFLAALTLALYWLYFALRIRFVLSAQKQEAKPFPLAWVFIAIELTVAVPVFMQSFWSIFILKKRNRPRLRLLGNEAPTIDVFITCCGEDDDLVLDTVRATCDVDYPPERFRIIVLDDGKSESLEKSVEALSETFQNLHYRCRPKFPGVPHHFKAGNLNYGLEEVHHMPGGASQFVAALDADMIPEQEWLRAIIPHLMIDDKMALACPPQLFYNVPASDPLCQSLDFFVHVSEPIKDALGVAWCTGSGYIVRRDALDEIGQFPRGSLAEDVATSTLLLGRGYKTAYIHESLQFGTVPDSYGSHLKQRTRWSIGTVETAFKLRFCLYGEKVRQMTFYQRMSSFVYAVTSLFNVFLTLSLFAMPVVLISNKPLVAYANDTQLRWLIRTCFAALVSNRLCELALYLPSGYATGQRGSRAHLWMSPYFAVTIIRSFVLPKWLGGQAQAFKPTGSLKSELNERDPTIRAPLIQRLRVILINYMASFHLAYVYFCLIAVCLSTIRCFQQDTLRKTLVCLLTHACWPPMAWIIVVSSFWIPITYAIEPPSMPPREDLLERNPKTGVAHPTAASKKIAFKPATALFELEYCVMTTFTAIVFAAAFFY